MFFSVGSTSLEALLASVHHVAMQICCDRVFSMTANTDSDNLLSGILQWVVLSGLLILPILWYVDRLPLMTLVVSEFLLALVLFSVRANETQRVSDVMVTWSATLFFVTTSVFLLYYIDAQYLNDATLHGPATDKDLLSNGTLLAVIATLGMFSGALVYVFKEVVERNIEKKMIEKADKHVKSMLAADKDERIASKMEGRLISSFILTKLHKMQVEIQNRSGELLDPVYVTVMHELSGILAQGQYLEAAVAIDASGMQILSDLTEDRHRDVILKVKNNRGYNLALKYTGKDREACEEEESFEQDRLIAQKIREELQTFLSEDGGKYYHDMTPEHTRQFVKTCREIEKVFGGS